jgi:hypothetical protein
MDSRCWRSASNHGKSGPVIRKKAVGFQAKRRLHAVYGLSFQPKRDFHAVCGLDFRQSAISMMPVIRVFRQSAISMISAILSFQAGAVSMVWVSRKRSLYGLIFQTKRDCYVVYGLDFGQARLLCRLLFGFRASAIVMSSMIRVFKQSAVSMSSVVWFPGEARSP